MSVSRAKRLLARIFNTTGADPAFEPYDELVELIAEELDNASEQWGPGPAADWRFWADGVQKFRDGTGFRLLHGRYPHTRRPNTTYAMIDGHDEPVGFDGHAVRTDIEIEEYNYLKSSSLSGDQVRAGCQLRVKMNDRLVYARGFRKSARAALWWAANSHELFEHPVKLWASPQPERPWPDLVPRLVFWNDMPGLISSYYPEQGCVIIWADLDDVRGGEFRVRGLDDSESTTPMVKADLLSPDIGWFRTQRVACGSCSADSALRSGARHGQGCHDCNGNGWIEDGWIRG